MPTHLACNEQALTCNLHTIAKFLMTPLTSRYMVAISGIPGSGKTTLAQRMSQEINKRHAEENPHEPPIAAWVGMDGFHLTRAQLAAMPDPKFAMARRGAPFTFDPVKLVELVRALRVKLEADSGSVYAPSFDHAIKDPVEGNVEIPPTARVIFFEGNYLSLNKDPWTEAARLMDELWFVEVDFETAKKRLVTRHVAAGIADDEVAAEKRVVENDLVNAKEIIDDRLEASEVIESREDSLWSH